MPVAVVLLKRAAARAIVRATGIAHATARKLVAERRRRPVRSVDDLASHRLSRRDVERLRRSGLFDDDHRVVITDVRPHRERIMSNRSFRLRVSFAAGGRANARLVSVRVSWTGQPFVVERLVEVRDRRAGFVDVRFARGQQLPPGPARFDVDLFSDSGAQASYRVTCAVLPSNPLPLRDARAPSRYAQIPTLASTYWCNEPAVSKARASGVGGDARVHSLGGRRGDPDRVSLCPSPRGDGSAVRDRRRSFIRYNRPFGASGEERRGMGLQERAAARGACASCTHNVW
jgi:hypothetical protein